MKTASWTVREVGAPMSLEEREVKFRAPAR